MSAPSRNTPEFDFLMYIGRFRPLHLGHESIIDDALNRSRCVIVFAGSANRPIGYKNPWSFEQVAALFEARYPEEMAASRLIVLPIADIMYNDEAWVAQVQRKMTSIMLELGNAGINGLRANDTNNFRVGLVGFSKDESSYYLKMFPQWESIEADQWGILSATDVRKQFFQRAPIIPRDVLSPQVAAELQKMMTTDQFRYIVEEMETIRDGYVKPWEGSPFLPHFVCCDSVVTQSGHVLLVTRGEAPGKGLLALPGGLVNPRHGGAYENVLRKLWLKAQPGNQAVKRNDRRTKPMPVGALRNFFTGEEKRFDEPGRDPRGFYSTTAFRFKFPDGPLWGVTGGVHIDGQANNAVEAAWYPIGSLDPREMFADHYFILQQMGAIQ